MNWILRAGDIGRETVGKTAWPQDRWLLQPSPTWRRDVRHKLEKPQIVISIRGQSRNLDNYAAIKDYRTTLLHEMLHTMFFIYEYRCDRGCRQRIYRESSGGHHISWQAAAFALEPGAWDRANLFDLYFGLHRESCLAADLLLGYNLPNESILRALRLDIGLI